jgi:conjugative transfer signal peptidase TraF
VDWLSRILSLWVNLSPSLPLGVYRPVDAPVTRGAIVVVCLPLTIGRLARERGYLGYGPCPGHVERLGKRVAAVAGDTVEIDAGGVRINRFLIPGSRPLDTDSRGRKLPRPEGRIVVQPGEVFLLATDNRRSFDSRYFGAVAVTDLTHLIVVERLVPH